MFMLLLTQRDLETRVYVDRCGWSGSFDEGTCCLDASTTAVGAAAGTVAPMSKRNARDMVKWARALEFASPSVTMSELPLLHDGESFRKLHPSVLDVSDSDSE